MSHPHDALVNRLPDHMVRNIVGAYGADGRDWLAQLPTIIDQCEQNWRVELLAPVTNLSYNFVATVRDLDSGGHAMLKIGVPNPELASEMAALAHYAGIGACQLLKADPALGALLLEHIQPGHTLNTVADDEEATRIAARVMAALWQPPSADHPFRTVNQWAQGLKRLRTCFNGGSGPLPQRIVEQAEGYFDELLASMEMSVVLHGDLHHDNILAAERAPWLAIDPKGIVGEPAYEVGALLRNMRPELRATAASITRRRVEILADELGFDPVRLLQWGVAQAVLSAWWCIEDNAGDECWRGSIQLAEVMQQLINESIGDGNE